MATFVPCERDQVFLRPPDLNDWLPQDDLAHVAIAASDRVPIAAFSVNDRNSGKPQYHPRVMLALLVYAYARGLFSSRRIERATHRDLGVRFVTTNIHPGHYTHRGVPATDPHSVRSRLRRHPAHARQVGAAAGRHGVGGRHQDRRECVQGPLRAV